MINMWLSLEQPRIRVVRPCMALGQGRPLAKNYSNCTAPRPLCKEEDIWADLSPSVRQQGVGKELPTTVPWWEVDTDASGTPRSRARVRLFKGWGSHKVLGMAKGMVVHRKIISIFNSWSLKMHL